MFLTSLPLLTGLRSDGVYLHTSQDPSTMQAAQEPAQFLSPAIQKPLAGLATLQPTATLNY